jgi:hypothetical protein
MGETGVTVHEASFQDAMVGSWVIPIPGLRPGLV